MNIERLEELARVATPGPWLYRAKSNALYTPPTPGTEYQYGKYILTVGLDSDDTDEQWATTEYITAADPSTILKLVAVVRAARAVIAASDTLNDTPIGKFTGEELPAYEAAEVALRAALEELKP